MVESQRSQLFERFCSSLLDQIAKAKGVTAKKRIFASFLQEWRREYGSNFYDPLRLLMPYYCHRMYNLKEASLANLILKAMSISPSSTDGKYLKDYKQPQANRPSGIFHLAVYDVVSRRSLVQHSSQTVKDVNKMLDALSTEELSNTQEESANVRNLKIFKEMMELYTPHQIQWIIRIILKDLKIGMSEISIMSVLHPNAKDLYAAGRSLSELCQSIENPNSELSSFGGVRLFSPCLPQCGFKCTSTNVDSSISKLSKPFYAEQKLDGERMLMHFDPETDKFMWFTRRKNDNSRRYGHSSKDINKLSGHIAKGLPNKSIILDGEMIAFDPIVNGFLPFGTLKSTSVNDGGEVIESVDVNVDINDPTKPHPCYVVFDILYYSGRSLINNTLRERIALLNIVVKNQKHHIKLIPRVELNTKEDIMKKLDEAVKNQEEGLVIKDPNSKYVLNSRLPTWIKFKPEYIDAMAENCDLIVVGSKYGSGKYGGILRQLLCAVRDDTIPTEEPPKFITFAMVHSGLSDADVTTFKNLAKTLHDYNPSKIPPWLNHPSNSNERPDKLVYYEDAIIVEIKGTEIIQSLQFGLKHTLRFPRMVRFRPDKGWKDIMTLSEFDKAKLEGRRGQKRETQEEVASTKKKGSRITYSVLNSQQGFNTAGIPVETSLFENMTFFVMNGNKKYHKHDIERLIHIHGGRFIQNKLGDVIVIGSDEDEMPFRLHVFKNKEMWDVIRAQYILDCIQSKDILPLEPKYMFVTVDATRKEFLKHMDEYGDHYTNFINEDDMKELLEKMGRDEMESDSYRRETTQKIVGNYFSTSTEGMRFVNVVAYFDYDTHKKPPVPLTMDWVKWKRIQDETKLGQERFEYELGLVTTSTLNRDVTHVIMNGKDLSRFKELKEAFHRRQLPRFVTVDWIQACISQNTLVNELDYQPRIPITL